MFVLVALRRCWCTLAMFWRCVGALLLGGFFFCCFFSFAHALFRLATISLFLPLSAAIDTQRDTHTVNSAQTTPSQYASGYTTHTHTLLHAHCATSLATVTPSRGAPFRSVLPFSSSTPHTPMSTDRWTAGPYQQHSHTHTHCLLREQKGRWCAPI